MVSTYQTRIADYGDVEPTHGEAALAAYAELYGGVQRKLFADFSAGELPASLKRVYLQRYGIPARMFNGLRVSLEGKVSSVRETMVLRRDSLQRRIARAECEMEKAVKGGRRAQVHHKRRRLANLRCRLAGLEADVAAGRVRLCFGSKRLWRKQHDLEVNGYGSHEEWLSDWRDSRSDEFFVLGSRDETAGCQLCVATIAEDGSLNLRVRMPDALAEHHGKYLLIQKVRFAYGHEQVLAALQSNAEYSAYRRQHGEKAARATGLGQAVSYRFKRDEKGWRVFVTTNMMGVPVVTDQRLGAIGVDSTSIIWPLLRPMPAATVQTLGGRHWSPMASPSVRLRPWSATPWPAWCDTPARSVSPWSSRGWTSAKRRLFWKASPAGTAGCCRLSATARSRRTSSPVATVRELRYTRSTRPFPA